MVSGKRYHQIADLMRYHDRQQRRQRGGKFSRGKLKRLVAENLGPSAAPLVKTGIDYGLSKALAFGKKSQNMREKSPCWKACTKHGCER